MKTIILFARMGLCNRLFSMANWEVIAKLSDRKLYVVWTMDNDICRTEFSTIFTNEDIIISKDEYERMTNGKTNLFLNINIGIANCDEEDETRIIDSIPNMTDDNIIVPLSCYFEPSIVRLSEFYNQTQQFLLNLKLKEHIQDKIQNYTFVHDIHPSNPRIYGIHIRRTDHASSKSMSVNDKFIDIIEAELNCYKNTKFFLATDCEQTKEFFQSLYPENIITYDKTYNNGNKQRPNTLDDAVIELYILAQTHHIFGSFGSSYSKMATVLRGCKFQQVGFC